MNYNPNDNDYEKPPSLYNGRINLMTKSANETAITMDNHENAFLMQDRIPVKSNDYNNALQGEIQNTMLSVAFFSKENQDIIQNGLRKGVYDMSQGKYVIDRQDSTVIQMVMRSVFLEHAQHNVDNIRGQISTLNDIVLEYLVKKAYNETVAYMEYKRDISTISEPMAPPVLSRITNQLQPKIGFQ